MILLLAASIAKMTSDPRCNSIGTNDLIECAASELRKADAELYRQWRKAVAKTKSQDANFGADDRAANGGLSFSQSLLASERAWFAYRDAQCRFSTYRNYKGREYRIYQLACLAFLTEQRVKQLTEFNKGQ